MECLSTYYYSVKCEYLNVIINSKSKFQLHAIHLWTSKSIDMNLKLTSTFGENGIINERYLTTTL